MMLVSLPVRANDWLVYPEVHSVQSASDLCAPATIRSAIGRELQWEIAEEPPKSLYARVTEFEIQYDRSTARIAIASITYGPVSNPSHLDGFESALVQSIVRQRLPGQGSSKARVAKVNSERCQTGGFLPQSGRRAVWHENLGRLQESRGILYSSTYFTRTLLSVVADVTRPERPTASAPGPSVPSIGTGPGRSSERPPREAAAPADAGDGPRKPTRPDERTARGTPADGPTGKPGTDPRREAPAEVVVGDGDRRGPGDKAGDWRTHVDRLPREAHLDKRKGSARPPEAGPEPPERRSEPARKYGRPSYPAEPGVEPHQPPAARGAADSPPASTAPDADRTVFVVEAVECSDEGNWLVGYLGFIEFDSDRAGGKVGVTQRHALNNYPGEGRTTHAALSQVPYLQCETLADPVRMECTAPRQVRALADVRAQQRAEAEAARRAKAEPAGAGDAAASPSIMDPPASRPTSASEWRCRAPRGPREQGVCLSRATDTWRCDVPEPSARREAQCQSVDPARWWCAPRKEFCHAKVAFGDWGSTIAEQQKITVKFNQDLVYPMRHGMVPIARHALQRVCGSGGAGAGGAWQARWRAGN